MKKIYTDGSRIKAIGATKEEYLKSLGVIIGWGSCTKDGQKLNSGSQLGGSNINSEMFAIRDALELLAADPHARTNILGEEKQIQIVTDSKTSIQIVSIVYKLTREAYMEGKKFDDLKMNEQSALRIKDAMKKLEGLGYQIYYKHIRGHGKDPFMSEEDIIGNQFADDIATEASKLENDKYKNNISSYQADMKWYSDNRFRLGYVK